VGRKKERRGSRCVARYRCDAKYYDDCGYSSPVSENDGRCRHRYVGVVDEDGQEYAFCRCGGAQKHLHFIEAFEKIDGNEKV